jgi:hypothetical protein
VLLKLQCLHNRGFEADTTPAPKTNMTTHTDTPNTVDQHTQAHCGQQPSVLTERVAVWLERGHIPWSWHRPPSAFLLP